MASRIFFFAHLLFLFPATISADNLGVTYLNCLRNVTSISSTFRGNLDSALRNLVHFSSAGSKYKIQSVGSGYDQTYALFQCRGDQTLHSCFDCVANVSSTLRNRCPLSIGARIQADGCFVRYDNQTFFTPDFTYIIGYCYGKTSDPVFLSTTESLMENVTTLAPKNGGYAAQSAEGVYALAQCLGYLNESECSTCLTKYSWRLTCDSALGEQYHSASCYYRYESYTFFTPTPPPPLSAPAASPRPALRAGFPTTAIPTHRRVGLNIVIAIVGAVVGVLLAAVVLHRTLVRRKNSKTSQGTDLLVRNDAWSENFLQAKAELFSLRELEVATGDFHSDNKLGEGGFGPVYKGTLQNGHHIAVKKLSSRSQQGRREFMNEVNLITSVQHKNLIKLLGSCIEGPHRMLVYEYLPNRSLDVLLFGDSTDARILDWPTRFGIILGMARGLAYLHEESQVRIIHRDIKPSNVLLDDQLNPVIADFGLARLVSDEESHIVTNVAGTLGYLAPEYAAGGQLTEKVDVFSFGVVALEIIAGRRNLDIQPSTENERLLDWAWRVYQEQRQLELVDPKLGPTFTAEEVIRTVHVALLCTQEMPVLRPTMFTVMLILSGRSDIMEIPTKPAYVGLSNLRAPQDSTGHSWSTTSSDVSKNPGRHISRKTESMSIVEPR